MKALYSIIALLTGGLVFGQAPTTAPMAPDRDAATVISVFSDEYEDVGVNTFSADFSNATFSEVTIADNQVLLYESLSFAGIELLGENALDLMAAGITTLHFDYWSSNSVTFSVKLVDFGGDGFTAAPGNDTEATVGRSLPSGEWVSVDLPIGLFVGMNMTDVSQIIISSVPAGESTVYLDNIYFYSGGVTIGGTPLDLPVTFEDDDVTYGLSDFGGAVSMIVEDPTDADNTVVETTKTAGAQTFAGTTLTLDLGGSPNDPGFATPIPFSATATTMQVRVWSPTVGTPVRLKVENSADNTVSVETETNTTVAMMWDTLVFDFSNEATGTAALNLASTYNKASIFFDFGTQPAEASTYYWDDVMFGGMSTGGGGGGGGDDAPTVAAPTPEEDAEDVISIYSDAYTDVPLTTLFTTWSDAAQTSVEIEGNNTLRYDNLNFTGIEVTGTNALDLSGFETMHVDIWSAEADTFQVKLVDFAGDGFTGGGADPEFELVFEPANGEWVSLEIPLSNFTGVPLTDIQQIIFSARPAGSVTVFVDNIYFSGGEGGGGGGGGDDAPTVAAPTPEVDAEDVISIYSDAYTDVPLTTIFTEWSVAMQTEVQIEGNNTLRYDNLNFTGIEVTGENALDLSGMTMMHVDVWTPNADTFQVKLVDANGTGLGTTPNPEFEVVAEPAMGEWVGIDLELSAFQGVPLTDIQQIIFSARPAGAATVFVDNIYFYSGDGGGGDMLTEAAPLPFPSPSSVISIYSDSYDDVAIDAIFTPWSVATQTEVVIEGNNTLRYDDLNFTGIEFLGENALDLVGAGMTHMRLDFYAVNADTFQIKLVDANGTGIGTAPNPEFELVVDTTMGEWISVDVPLSAFEGVPLTDVQQIVLSARPAGAATVYVDNIFFYDATSTSTTQVEAGVLAAFPNPANERTTLTAPQAMERLIVFDAAGRVVAEHRPRTARFELPLGELRPGLYFALATTAEGQFSVRLNKR